VPDQPGAVAARARDVRLARTLSVFSVGWGAVAAVVALALGLAGGGLSLIGFGLDSAIDSSASIALVWRFHIEGRDPERAARVEHLAERIVGGVLVVAAVFLAVGAARTLAVGAQVHPQAGQLVLLVASLLALPPLAVAKRRVAGRLGSRALHNDALLTAAAAFLALIALVAGEIATSLGLAWADPLGSIVIAAVLGREGLASLGEASAGNS
jgi:divalent metal cation (Fe/Co/Zn/Cd) transporter